MSEQLIGYRIADFYLDLHNKVLSHNGQHLDVNERTFKLLSLLCEASPEPLSKQSLSSLLWQDTVVSDWSLFRLISDTRQLLGDDGEQQQLIHTARGIGFYITQVQACYGDDPAAMVLNAGVSAQRRRWGASAGTLLAIVLIAGVLYWPNYQQQQVADAIQRVSQYQDNTYTTFLAQVARRNELGEMITKRLGVKRDMQWEKFFSYHYALMNEQEKFVCEQIRSMTQTGLYENNYAILHELERYPQIFDEIEGTEALQQHLAFWLNKFEGVFQQREDMCLLYVGVEDGVPYPSGVDKRVKDWLAVQSSNLSAD